MRTILMLTMLSLLTISSVFADVPTTMNYQGRLTDAAGNPVADASYSVVFTAYDAAVAGTSVWTETQNVTTTDGLFAILLGSINPIEDTVFNGTTRYLGIAVAGDPELSPRTAMVSVPYAQRVSTVDGASGGNITNKLTIGSGHTNSGSSAFVAGENNIAIGDWSTIGGGNQNYVEGIGAVVAGGVKDSAIGNSTTIGGGDNNTTFGAISTISGGTFNTCTDAGTVIGGGSSNTAFGWFSSVLGGEVNFASGRYGSIGGGVSNTTDDTAATVGGGQSNSAIGEFSVVSGGLNNVASGHRSVVGGGESDTAFSLYSGVSSGFSNLAGDETTDTAAYIGGGYDNTAIGPFATVGGGTGNSASGISSTVGGGGDHMASGDWSTVGGGGFNIASGNWSTVGGGSINVATGLNAIVSGGSGNVADGAYSTIPGGISCGALGFGSFASGFRAKANHGGTFVWADSTDADFASTGNNQFLIRASGGVGIGTNSPLARLHVKGSGFPSSFGIFDTDSIGQNAGIRFHEVGTVKSHLFHATSTNTLNLYGQGFSGISVSATGTVGIGTNAPNYKLDVRGNIGNNATLHHSDRRWKDNIESLNKSLDKIQQLRGVSFDWRRKEFSEMNFPEGKQIGLIAQEVEQVIPELVNTNNDGYKSVDYSKLVALLIEANKEQQKQIKSQQDQIDELKKLVQQLADKSELSNSSFGIK